MSTRFDRRRFLAQLGRTDGWRDVGGMRRNLAGASRAPGDYVIVEGHRDIWELSDRFKVKDPAQHFPMRDFLVPRLIEGGVSVVIMPAGGDSSTRETAATDFWKVV